MGGGTAFSASPATVSIPTGAYTPKAAIDTPFTFTVPNKITIVQISNKLTKHNDYIGVTPGKAYELIIKIKPAEGPQPEHFMLILGNNHNSKIWSIIQINNNNIFIISWSPEINSMTPTIKDY